MLILSAITVYKIRIYVYLSQKLLIWSLYIHFSRGFYARISGLPLLF